MLKIPRKTEQFILPVDKPGETEGEYNIYPTFKVDDNQIFTGFDSITSAIRQSRTVMIDGYAGVYFDIFTEKLDEILSGAGTRINWIRTTDFLKSEKEILGITAPYSGGDDALFGKRCDLSLEDFFDLSGLRSEQPDPAADISVIIGPGAFLSCRKGLKLYIDLPKNELQYRARAGEANNLGLTGKVDPGVIYKRFYFIDWPVLNRHKGRFLPEVDIFIDGQRPGDPVWMQGSGLRNTLHSMSHNLFRARPWFEPGPWGGTWIKDRIGGLNKDVANYAWSFELITPENGLLIESSGKMLEVSFDSLMYLNGREVLGDCYERFGNEFPIRFDFLDTFDGGNLSLQCHPRPEYARHHFGENFTQEESYYILDTKDDGVVYLGFRDNIDPVKFRSELEASAREKVPFNAADFIQTHTAQKHDLFLIPYGTVHGSGRNNLVLEISSTPYIFTFKMYDWLRPDLSGRQRQLNISRAMDNLYFDRKGSYVREKLISKPVLIQSGKDWQKWHLPTHDTHLYDVHRIHFKTTAAIATEDKCLVMSLVEGSSITVETENGMRQQFNYAETFVIPAAAGSITVTNNSGGNAIMVIAFVK